VFDFKRARRPCGVDSKCDCESLVHLLTIGHGRPNAIRVLTHTRRRKTTDSRELSICFASRAALPLRNAANENEGG
jgi:hypothetical protein